MTYRELIKNLGNLTEQQLDENVILEVGHNFYRANDINVASGEGDYLYKDEVYISIESNPLDEKDY